MACGTTAEAATLLTDEHVRVVWEAGQAETFTVYVEQSAGQVPVIVGAASNDIRAAARAGADSPRVVLPHYNRPARKGV